MVKSFIWTGIVILTIGVIVGGVFVVPHIGHEPTVGLNGTTMGIISPLAVLVAALGLAIGCALIGIGIGHWKHPKPATGAGATGPAHGGEI
jgi:hypothetical protein